MDDMTQEPPAAEPAPEDDGWIWAVVEIMGHRKHACRAREVEQFGAKMIRIDIPIKGDPVANGWQTHCYGGPAIFSFTPTDEATVMRMNKPYDPMANYRLAAPVSHDVGEPDLAALNDEDDEPF